MQVEDFLISEEKVNVATNFQELVERYLKRLDVECHKFKMELEADNRGITEILEKRSLDLDQPSQAGSGQKENLYVRSSHMSGSYGRLEFFLFEKLGNKFCFQITAIGE